MRSIVITVSVSLFVCLSVCSFISETVQTSQNFLLMLSMSVARSNDDSSICYIHVLPLLWTASCFDIMEPMGQNQMQRYVLSSSPSGCTGAKLMCTIAGVLCLLVI